MSNTVEKQLKVALRYLDQPEKIAERSDLATPFFLGSAVQRGVATDNLGALLARELIATAETLWGATPPRNRAEVEAVWNDILQEPDTNRYHYLILELRYLNRFFRPRTLQSIWTEFTKQSRAEFYRDVDAAVRVLAELLIVRLRPIATREQPPEAPHLIGRKSALDTCLQAARSGKCINLIGAAGMGKTSLAAAVAAQWQNVFWFTVPTAADRQTQQFIVALADFLQQQVRSRLWRALAANGGTLTDLHLARTLAAQDMADLAAAPLLCIDECNRWQEGKAWIESLQLHSALLLIGQQPLFDVEQTVLLEGLSVQEAAQLFHDSSVPLSQLVQQTGGNPRLLRLANGILESGGSVEGLLSAESDYSLLHISLRQLQQYLSTSEQKLLQILAVFEVAAPVDAFDATLIATIRAHGLTDATAIGTVALLPAVRDILVEQSTDDHHLIAAQICLERGEYTLAAHHFLWGDRPKLALHCWFPHRQQEIQRGQAALARRIFSTIDLSKLSKRDVKAVRLIRAELHKLLGEAREGADELATNHSDDSELALLAATLRGEFLAELGYPDRALTTYADGVQTTARLLNSLVTLHVRQSLVGVNQRDLTSAWRTAQFARYNTEQLYGLVLEQRGDLDAAFDHYQTALTIAEQLNHVAGLTETHRALAKVYNLRQQIDQAVKHAEIAIDLCEQRGDLLAAQRIRSNLAGIYLNNQQFERAISVGKEALAFFQQMNAPTAIAGTACNVAEASFELGRDDDARQYALLALQQEEPLAQPYALYTLGLLAQRNGQMAEATKLLHDCQQIAQRNEDRFIEAYAWLKSAEITHSPQSAQQAIDLFTQLGIDAMTNAATELKSRLLA